MSSVKEISASGATGYTGTPYSAGISNWATLRGAATEAGTTILVGTTRLNSPGNKSLYRAFLMFDLTSLNALSISAANLKFTVSSCSSDLSNHTVYIVPTNPASPTTSLTTADHTSMTMTDYGNFSKNGITGAQSFALNATGVAAMPLTGLFKIGLSGYYDFANSDPGSGNAAEELVITSVVLEVTYVAKPSAGNPLFFSTGVAIG